MAGRNRNHSPDKLGHFSRYYRDPCQVEEEVEWRSCGEDEMRASIIKRGKGRPSLSRHRLLPFPRRSSSLLDSSSSSWCLTSRRRGRQGRAHGAMDVSCDAACVWRRRLSIRLPSKAAAGAGWMSPAGGKGACREGCVSILPCGSLTRTV
ncbi:hypothetical protein C2845_PM06G19810 [Panicum miliaceum]|uniref:Uncharacterized protein n=1 Tax=Panicum miliaceum TaxID=4540 RepID=A0A3L6R5T8_PANMI|nr:hypothetical protein C2845_PM06G19810 [Panicum miliaceum]